jgi:hypothetical protein
MSHIPAKTFGTESASTEATEPPPTSLPSHSNNSSDRYILDSGGNKISRIYYYKIKFRDRSKLSVGTTKWGPGNKIMVGPPSSGPSMWLQGDIDFMKEAVATQLRGLVSPNVGNREQLHLSLDSFSNELCWYSRDNGYGIWAEMVSDTKRVILYGVDKEGKRKGLRATWDENSRLHIIQNKWDVGLECQFVRVTNKL